MEIGTYKNVVHIILLDLSSKVNRDLNPVLSVLFLDSMQERMEPLGSAKVADDPNKVHLP